MDDHLDSSELLHFERHNIPQMDETTAQNLMCVAIDKESIRGEAVVAIPYIPERSVPGTPIPRPDYSAGLKLLVGTTSMMHVVRFNRQGVQQYNQAHAFWDVHQHDFSMDAIMDARKQSDEMGADFVAYREFVHESDLADLGRSIVLWHGEMHYMHSRERLEKVEREIIPQLIDSSYSWRTLKGIDRRLRETPRSLAVVDIPEELVPRLKALPGGELMVFGQSTGFTLSAQGTIECILSSRMARAMPTKDMAGKYISIQPVQFYVDPLLQETGIYDGEHNNPL